MIVSSSCNVNIALMTNVLLGNNRYFTNHGYYFYNVRYTNISTLWYQMDPYSFIHLYILSLLHVCVFILLLGIFISHLTYGLTMTIEISWCESMFTSRTKHRCLWISLSNASHRRPLWSLLWLAGCHGVLTYLRLQTLFFWFFWFFDAYIPLRCWASTLDTSVFASFSLWCCY